MPRRPERRRSSRSAPSLLPPPLTIGPFPERPARWTIPHHPDTLPRRRVPMPSWGERMRRAVAIGTILSVLLGLFPALAGAQASAARRCFPETGFCVEGRFLDYWNAHGSLAINGFPLSEE